MSTTLTITLPSHGEVGYDTELNAALTAIVSNINSLYAVVEGITPPPTGDLTVVANGDGTYSVAPVGVDVTVNDNGDDTFNVGVVQPAVLRVVDNGDGSFEVIP